MLCNHHHHLHPKLAHHPQQKPCTHRQCLSLLVCFLIRDPVSTWLSPGLSLVARSYLFANRPPWFDLLPDLLRNPSQDCPNSCNIVLLDSWYWLPLWSCPFLKVPYRYRLPKWMLPRHLEIGTLSVPPLGTDLRLGPNPWQSVRPLKVTRLFYPSDNHLLPNTSNSSSFSRF